LKSSQKVAKKVAIFIGYFFSQKVASKKKSSQFGYFLPHLVTLILVIMKNWKEAATNTA
jgi:hypothetical protein